jgi:hypothetical protein
VVECMDSEGMHSRLPALYTVYLPCCFLTGLFTRLTVVCTTRYGVEQRESLALTACVDIAASSLLFFDYNLLFFSALRKKVDDTGAELGNDNNGG